MRLSEAVLESMSYIDESYLAESEAEKKMSFSFKPFLSFAAVFALVMAVVLNPSKSADNSVPEVSEQSAEAAAEEENAFDGIAYGTVLYDQKLSEALAGMSDSDVVKVRIETIVSDQPEYAYDINERKNAGTDEETMTVSEPADEQYREMSKQEIFSFEGEEGITYIFHLYEENDME